MITEYILKSVSSLIPYENNPRDNDAAVADVAESIRQCTYIAPIIVDENNVILAGHTRLRALQSLNINECEVLVVKGLSEEKKRKFRLYDNKTSEFAEWDERKLMEELSDVDFQGYDFGQPENKEKLPSNAKKSEKSTRVCPCCGEVFEV